MSAPATNLTAWQRHARQRLAQEPPEPRPAPARFEWSQQPGSGPSAEILGPLDGRRIVELGCGAGHNLAHLVACHGGVGIGIDVAPAQIERAHAYYGHLPAVTFTVAEAIDHLASAAPIDVCVSVFGAVGLTSPEPLLAAIADRLSPGGRLAFSVRLWRQRPDRGPTDEPLTLPNGQTTPTTRWHLDPPSWARQVQAVGLTLTGLLAMPPPALSQTTGTLIVLAARA